VEHDEGIPVVVLLFDHWSGEEKRGREEGERREGEEGGREWSVAAHFNSSPTSTNPPHVVARH
jgi:hypothetical protein